MRPFGNVQRGFERAESRFETQGRWAGFPTRARGIFDWFFPSICPFFGFSEAEIAEITSSTFFTVANGTGV